jgi:hypothetical protein
MEYPENDKAYKGLTVNAGVEQPSSINPYLKARPKRPLLSAADYVDGIVKETSPSSVRRSHSSNRFAPSMRPSPKRS